MKEKILITVKTYPTLSTKYWELVCTAGVTEKGEWRRLYPIRFRQLYDTQKYKKYQWIEVGLEKSDKDPRPESYRIIHNSLKILSETPLPTTKSWQERRASFLNKINVYENLHDLIQQARRNELSLAAFRPQRFISFSYKETARQWDEKKLKILEQEKKQLHLFDDEETVARQLEVVKKLPYTFYYHFEDSKGKKSKLMIEDWEIGSLYWNCLKSSKNNEQEALAKVKEKYWNRFVLSGKHDIVLILGTTLEHHNKKAPNPFVIISVWYPPPQKQMTLF